VTREREPFPSLFMYYAFKWLVVSPMLHTYWQGKIYGAEKIPKKGPFLVVSNHASNYDPVLLSCCVGRPVAYMAKEELFEIPVLKTAMKIYGAYPVNRERAGSGTIKAAMEYLENGWGLGVFMGGTRTADGKIADPKAGAALIAAKAQVPVIPISLWGTHELEVPGRKIPAAAPLTIRIGDILEPPASSKRALLDEATAKWTAEIDRLHELGR
jgi:1-acyl-sn-glycerol-3-phosphate acyltransferase